MTTMSISHQQALQPVEHQLIINYHKGGQITFNFPQNMEVCGMMLGVVLREIMKHCEFKPPSSIIQVPPGTRLMG